jgi:hypothetical protein
MIVGDLPHFTAVSIGWPTSSMRKRRFAALIARVRGSAGARRRIRQASWS